MNTKGFIRRIFLAPLLLAMRAEGGNAPAQEVPQPAATPTAIPTAQPTAIPTAQPSADDIAGEVMAAIEKRSQRLEGSITRSVAEKYGMTDEEVNAILAAEKQKRDRALPADVQQRLDDAMNAANERLIAAEIRVQAAALGFVDTDDAIRLLSRDSVKVDDNGDVTGVREALEALAQAKPHLIKQTGAWGARQGASQGSLSGVEEAFYRRNPELRKS